MLLSLKKKTHTHTKTITSKQTKTATTYNSPCFHHSWTCYQVIALNDQQGGRWISTQKKLWLKIDKLTNILTSGAILQPS